MERLNSLLHVVFPSKKAPQKSQKKIKRTFIGRTKLRYMYMAIIFITQVLPFHRSMIKVSRKLFIVSIWIQIVCKKVSKMWWMFGYWGITDFEIYMVYCPMKGVYNRVAVGLTKLCQIMKSVIRILQYHRNLDNCFF